MANWIPVIREGALAPGEHVLIDADGIQLVVFNSEGRYLAIENLCSHDGNPINEGRVEEGEIICPRHGARFCLKTGRVLGPPAYEDIPAHAVRVHDGQIEVDSEPS